MTLREQAIASMAVAWSLNADMGDALDALLSWLRDNATDLEKASGFKHRDGTRAVVLIEASTLELIYLLGEQ